MNHAPTVTVSEWSRWGMQTLFIRVVTDLIAGLSFVCASYKGRFQVAFISMAMYSLSD